MSTRARIGYQFTNWNGDQKIISIYNHSDGYPAGLGKVLLEHYNTPDRIVRLMTLGDISGIGTEPVDCPDMWDPNSPIYHAENSLPEWNVCRTYKGRGEEGCEAKLSDSVKEMIEKLGEEYCYLFKDGKWFIVDLLKSGKVEYEAVEAAIRNTLKAC